MLRRIAVVTTFCAALVPFTAGSASASCLDDFEANAFRSDAAWHPSDHFLNWVHVQGTATVTIEGDDLIYDVAEFAGLHLELVTDSSASAPAATADFVDCVAG